jgi:hypothetical protein
MLISRLLAGRRQVAGYSCDFNGEAAKLLVKAGGSPRPCGGRLPAD